MKKIILITGIRSEYEVVYSVLRALKKMKDVNLGIICTGAHNSKMFGLTIEEMRNDGFSIVGVIENLLNSDSLVGRAKSTGILLSSLPEILARENPDIVFALGDREEPLIAAIACNFLNIPFAHIAGGDRAFPTAGDIDEGLRHATTKLSHLHLTMMEEHKTRILKMGEEPWRVFNVGNPGLDRIILESKISLKSLSQRIGIKLENKKIIVVIQHVVHQESDFAKDQMTCTLNSLKDFDANIIIISPNSDRGSIELISVISDFVRDNHNYYNFANLPRDIFINLLRNADLLIGNSSAGLLEAPLLKLPTINVGERQRERKHSSNVIFVPFNEKKIQQAIKKSLYDSEHLKKVNDAKSIYGDGKSGQRIANILVRFTDMKSKLLAKDITY